MWRWNLFFTKNFKFSNLVYLKLVHFCILDIDECKEKSACQCDGCKCKNKWGSFKCKCSAIVSIWKTKTLVSVNVQKIVKTRTLSYSHLYVFVSAERSGSRIGWFFTFVILPAVAGICVASYVLYKYRLRVRFLTRLLLFTNLHIHHHDIYSWSFWRVETNKNWFRISLFYNFKR